jgi:replicative DNA helicase
MVEDNAFFGREMPSNVLAEAALLGALLHRNSIIEQCEGLRSEHFHAPEHALIYAAIVEGVAAGHLVDAVSLKGRFDTKLLSGLLRAMVGLISAREYAQVIRETALSRRVIEIAESWMQVAYAGAASAAEIAANATAELDALMTGSRIGTDTALDAAMDASLTAMDKAAHGGTAGVSTGFPSLDKRLGGLEPGLVYVIAGRPGMGKSALGHEIAINVARAGHAVHELSLEMSATQLGRRALSTASGVGLSRFKTGDVSDEQAARIVQARQELGGLPLTIDDTAGQTPAQIATKIRAVKRQRGKLGLVMIDHLNLMRAEDMDARHGGTWAVERASATVLQIAKDCEVPVLLLTQLNRGVEGREDKRPVLSDLRQAGAIEQDAYAVGFVYRAEYYLKGAPEQGENERDGPYEDRLRAWHDHKERQRGKAEIIFAKVRDGEPGTDPLSFHAATATFGEPQP